jgi:cytochrome c oxidase subunit 2
MGILLTIFLIVVIQAVDELATDLPDCIPYDESFINLGIKKNDDKLYQVYVNARMWNFEPNEMYFLVGSTTYFYLSSNDVVHGFHLADEGINMMAVPGGINKITAAFNKLGVKILYVTNIVNSVINI